MIKEEILDQLKLSDLQEQHREFAEVIGVENLINLSHAFGGSSIYIPQPRELAKNKVYKSIAEEYDGTNMKKLAVKYQVSESTVYGIVKDKINRSIKANLPGQMNFADYGI